MHAPSLWARAIDLAVRMERHNAEFHGHLAIEPQDVRARAAQLLQLADADPDVLSLLIAAWDLASFTGTRRASHVSQEDLARCFAQLQQLPGDSNAAGASR